MQQLNKSSRFFADCHVFDGHFQGTTTYLQGLYTELIKDKSKTFFLAAHDTQHLEEIFGLHENVVYLKYKSKNKFIRLLFEIPRLIKKNKIQYAHFQYIVPPVKCCKYIVTIHDILFLDYPQYFPLAYKIKNNFLFKISAYYSDIVLTVSEFSKQRIIKHYKTPNITVTPNGVEDFYFEAYDKTAVAQKVKALFGVDNYWLYVSRWEPRKNHLTLLKTFVEKGYYKDNQLVFVGAKAIKNKTYDEYYNALPAEIQKRIVTLHNINREQLLDLTRAAALSAYPSVAEGFGIPPLESVAAQVPTICSNATAMGDFGFLGNCLFDPFDTTGIHDAAIHALTGKDIARQRKIVKEKYSWKIAAHAFMNAVEQ